MGNLDWNDSLYDTQLPRTVLLGLPKAGTIKISVPDSNQERLFLSDHSLERIVHRLKSRMMLSIVMSCERKITHLKKRIKTY